VADFGKTSPGGEKFFTSEGKLFRSGGKKKGLPHDAGPWVTPGRVVKRVKGNKKKKKQSLERRARKGGVGRKGKLDACNAKREKQEGKSEPRGPYRVASARQYSGVKDN